MAIVTVVAGFALAFGDLGFSSAIIHHQDSSPDDLFRLYGLNLAMGACICSALVALSSTIAGWYGNPRLIGLIRLASISFLIAPIGQQYQALLQRELRFRELAKIEIAANVTGATAGVLTAWLGSGVYALVWASLSSATVRASLLYSFGRDLRPARSSGRPGNLSKYIRFGLFVVGERLINFTGWQLDKLIISAFLGPILLGYYSVSYQLVTRPFQIINPILTRVAFPVFAKVQTDDGRLRCGYLELTGASAIILMPLYAGMISAAEPFILVLLGPNWTSAVPLLQVLAILGIFYGLGNPIGSLLLAKGRSDICFGINILMLFLYAIAVITGLSHGLIGIAWCLVGATAFVLFPLGFWIRWSLVRMSPPEYIQAFLPALSSSLVMGVLVLFVKSQIGGPPAFQLTILVIIGAASYVGLLTVLDRSRLERLWQAVLSRRG